MHVLVVFGNGGGVLLSTFTLLCNPHHTGRIEDYKQYTTDLQLLALFLSH